MGSWNKTCSLSNLPIFHGDKTVLYFIVNRTYQGAAAMPSYPSAEWVPIPLPFYGTYNDYGWQDMDKGQEWKLDVLHDALSDQVKPYINKNNTEIANKIDKSIDKNIFKTGYKEIFDRIHRGNFEFDMNGQSINRVSFVMMHDQIADAVASSTIPIDYETIFDEFETYRKLRYDEDVKIYGKEAAEIRNCGAMTDNLAWSFAQEKKFSYDDPMRRLLLMSTCDSASENRFNGAIYKTLSAHENGKQSRHLVVEAAAIQIAYYGLRRS